jgi:hypothetical protein
MKREINHLGFFKSMPPIKKSAKLVSGSEKGLKKWLPLVRHIKKTNKAKVIIDLDLRFLIKVIFIPNSLFILL